jgi:hypothetical protein
VSISQYKTGDRSLNFLAKWVVLMTMAISHGLFSGVDFPAFFLGVYQSTYNALIGFIIF